jgi:hypothetical protein
MAIERPPHYHCPRGCENPQPYLMGDGRRICQKCLYDVDELVEVVLCDPETCDD